MTIEELLKFGMRPITVKWKDGRTEPTWLEYRDSEESFYLQYTTIHGRTAGAAEKKLTSDHIAMIEIGDKGLPTLDLSDVEF